jgi:Sulfotransferase family
MMMRMIAAAGITQLTDGLRTPDEDNPLGYAELEAVKRTREDASWLAQAPGKVVKLVHLLLKDLPSTHRYSVVMMHRDPDEVLASQRKMLERSGKPGGQISPEALKKIFASQMQAVTTWLASQPNFRVLHVQYGAVLANPAAEAERVAAFLGTPEMSAQIAAAVEPTLYRNRK